MKSLVVVVYFLLSLTCIVATRIRKRNNIQQQTETIAINSHRELQQPIVCTTDDDCFNEFGYCSAGICRSMGSCRTIEDCLNPSNLYPTDRCLGYLLCSLDKDAKEDDEADATELEGKCKMECQNPFCPPDTPVSMNCNNPCERRPCDEPYVSCVGYSCGGCNAYFFDSAGSRICTTTNDNNTMTEDGSNSNDNIDGVDLTINLDINNSTDTTTRATTNFCNNNLECVQPGQYCASGECIDIGTCYSSHDCYNPNNKDIVDLVTCSKGSGTLYCSSNKCKRICDACFTTCGDTDPCTNSLPLCQNGINDGDLTCVNDHCNCEAFIFDRAGNHVCNEYDMMIIPNLNAPPESFYLSNRNHYSSYSSSASTTSALTIPASSTLSVPGNNSSRTIAGRPPPPDSTNSFAIPGLPPPPNSTDSFTIPGLPSPPP